jgi:hypothetical protein
VDGTNPSNLVFLKGAVIGAKESKVLLVQWGKRKLLWKLWDQNRGIYKNYEEFKKYNGLDTKFWEKIENDVREDIKSNIREITGYREMKKEIRRSIRKDVEKLLQEQRPFG